MQKFYAIIRDVKCNRNAFNLERVPKHKPMFPSIDSSKTYA